MTCSGVEQKERSRLREEKGWGQEKRRKEAVVTRKFR